jgi:mannose-6-phosphate isomerase, type 1 (EC 5.3.1.8)
LKTFFAAVMSLQGVKKKLALSQLYAAYTQPATNGLVSEALEYSKRFYQHYADDIGLFSPLMLKTLELSPGEAMFLGAETPHAYVEGTAPEIMANSDNVLRAGLTLKHIDVNELIDNTQFKETKPSTLA